MNNLLSLIITLFIAFEEIYGQNTTDSGEETTSVETTQGIYTTIQTLPDLTSATDPLDEDDSDCVFDYMGVLNDGEDIEISICGYLSNDDDEEPMVGIQLQLPRDRWVGVGFTNDDTDDGVYTIILPAYSREIEERYIESDDAEYELEPTVVLYEDMYDNGMRIVKIKRNVTISLNGLTQPAQPDLLKYFDFATFQQCDDTMTISWAFAANSNDVFNGNETYPGSNNQGTVDAEVMETLGIDCDGGNTDDGNSISIICGIAISMIAVLFR